MIGYLEIEDVGEVSKPNLNKMDKQNRKAIII